MYLVSRISGLLAIGVAGLLQPAMAQSDRTPAFDSDADELLYYWGTTFGQQLEAAGITEPEQLEWVARGLRDQARGVAPEFGDEYRSLLSNYLVLRQKEAAEAEARAAEAYLSDMTEEDGALVTDSGLVYRELARGDGPRPTRGSKVKVHYTGTLRDGTVFDSSRERGEPLVTRLTRVISCWSEGIPMMRVGGKARLGCPPELAYGERGNRRIPGGAALNFEVELLEIVE